MTLFHAVVRIDHHAAQILQFDPDHIEAMGCVEIPLLATVRPDMNHPRHVAQEPIWVGREEGPRSTQQGSECGCDGHCDRPTSGAPHFATHTT